jgi:hypothetical protein
VIKLELSEKKAMIDQTAFTSARGMLCPNLLKRDPSQFIEM